MLKSNIVTSNVIDLMVSHHDAYSFRIQKNCAERDCKKYWRPLMSDQCFQKDIQVWHSQVAFIMSFTRMQLSNINVDGNSLLIVCPGGVGKDQKVQFNDWKNRLM